MSSADAPKDHERSALRRAGAVLLFGLVVGALSSGLNLWLSPAGLWAKEENGWFSVHWAMLAEAFGANRLDFVEDRFFMLAVGLGMFALSSLCAALPILLRPSLARPVVAGGVLALVLISIPFSISQNILAEWEAKEWALAARGVLLLTCITLLARWWRHPESTSGRCLPFTLQLWLQTLFLTL